MQTDSLTEAIILVSFILLRETNHNIEEFQR
jgi:hypothetical protein